MSTTLTIGRGVEIPLEYAVHRNAVLGISGSGKSNLAVVLAEEMHAAGIPWVAIDPKGDWFGIRSNAKGTGAGLPVPVFGGPRGDMPVDPRHGAQLAALCAEKRLTCVLDLSDLDDEEDLPEFLTSFARTLYERNREPLHIFADEADVYIPQTLASRGPLGACLRAWRKLATKGRSRALGITLISQRSAMVCKSVLYQAETLAVMRTRGPGDLHVIRGWVKHNSANGDIVDSLPSLKNGQGWLCSPHVLGTVERFQARRRRTFDSGATPEIGERRAPATLADIDLAALQGELAAAFERAESEDPEALRRALAQERRRVSDLEAQLAARPAETVEVPVLDDEAFARLEGVLTTFHSSAIAAVEVARDALARLPQAPSAGQGSKALDASASTDKPVARERQTAKVARQRGAGSSSLPKVERLILTALAQHRASPMKRQRLALLVGYNARSKGFLNGLGALRGRGAVVGLEITEEGLCELGDYDELPTDKDALIGWWCFNKLSPAEGRILRAVDSGGGKLGRHELAARAGYENPRTKSFMNGLGRLRGLGLVDGFGLSKELFR